MKGIILLFLFTISIENLLGQKLEPTHEVSTIFRKIYVAGLNGYFVAFDMGKYLDKAGVGSSIKLTDTIKMQTDKSYRGSNFKIELNDGQFYISDLDGKKRKVYKLEKVNNIQQAKYDLNNAYYLDSYFTMSSRLIGKFHLRDHSFRTGFRNWDSLHNKEIEHLEFRKFTDSIIQQEEDSIALTQQNKYQLTHFIINNIQKLSYQQFRDSIFKLPAVFGYQGSYYETVVVKVSKIKPEYVVALYKDDPVNRSLIELAVKKDKPLWKQLKWVRSSERSSGNQN